MSLCIEINQLDERRIKLQTILDLIKINVKIPICPDLFCPQSTNIYTIVCNNNMRITLSTEKLLQGLLFKGGKESDFACKISPLLCLVFLGGSRRASDALNQYFKSVET